MIAATIVSMGSPASARRLDHERIGYRHARSIDESGRSARNAGLLSLGRRDHSSHAGSVLIDEGLELLEETEALRLLAGGEIGRVGVTMGALPAIFPVNYRLIDGCIVFRSSPGSKLSAAASGAVVAFEVDDYNAADRSGWSVLVVGPSEVVHDLDVTFRTLEAGLQPYVDGPRGAIIRIEPTFVSGRRIVHVPAGDVPPIS
jgi:nitroimidazol reductase NimA-like FMN-containing flavoprotein (pyridoxamine 5'-phosphate oxidase superfamily)